MNKTQIGKVIFALQQAERTSSPTHRMRYLNGARGFLDEAIETATPEYTVEMKRRGLIGVFKHPGRTLTTAAIYSVVIPGLEVAKVTEEDQAREAKLDIAGWYKEGACLMVTYLENMRNKGAKLDPADCLREVALYHPYPGLKHDNRYDNLTVSGRKKPGPRPVIARRLVKLLRETGPMERDAVIVALYGEISAVTKNRLGSLIYSGRKKGTIKVRVDGKLAFTS